MQLNLFVTYQEHSNNNLMFINSANIEHPPFIYLYIPIAYTLFSANLCVTHGDGFKNDPDSVISFKFVVQEESEGRSMDSFNMRRT